MYVVAYIFINISINGQRGFGIPNFDHIRLTIDFFRKSFMDPNELSGAHVFNSVDMKSASRATLLPEYRP